MTLTLLSLFMTLSDVAATGLAIASVLALFDTCRRETRQKRLQSIHWVDGVAVLTARSRVNPSVSLRRYVSYLVWADRVSGGRVAMVLTEDLVQQELHKIHDTENGTFCALTFFLFLAVCGKLCESDMMKTLSVGVIACIMMLEMISDGKVTKEIVAAANWEIVSLNVLNNPTANEIRALDLGITSLLCLRRAVPIPRAPVPAPAPRRPSPVVSRAPTPGIPADGQPECVVCLANQRTHVAFPCGHLAVCGPCAAQVRDQCPVCMGHAHFTRLFHP